MPRTAERTLAVLLLLTATAVLGGCSKADSPTVTAGPSNSAGSTTGGGSSTASSTGAGTTGGGTSAVGTGSTATTPTPTGPASTSPAQTSSTVGPATSAPRPVAAGCPASALSISVQRGSGVAGHQYATVIFKNTSAATCPLSGFPGIQLLAAGVPLGTSLRSGAAASTVSLVPGASASSELVNDSTCGAAVSDSVQVIAPNTTTKVILPLAFRGCAVTVDPVRQS